MESRFLNRFGSLVKSVLSGFDRIVIRGVLQELVRPGGMHALLMRSGIRDVDFRDYVQHSSDSVKRASQMEAERLARPVLYLPSASVRKEDVAKQLLKKHPIKEPGLLLL